MVCIVFQTIPHIALNYLMHSQLELSRAHTPHALHDILPSSCTKLCAPQLLGIAIHCLIAVVLRMEWYTSPLIWQLLPMPTLSSSMCSHAMHNWLALVGMVDRHGQSNSTICSPCGPYQALWSEGSYFFLPYLTLWPYWTLAETPRSRDWWFLCGQQWQRRRHNRLLYPCTCVRGNNYCDHIWEICQ